MMTFLAGVAVGIVATLGFIYAVNAATKHIESQHDVRQELP